MKRIIFSIIILFLFQHVRAQLYDKIQYAGDKELSLELVSDIEAVFEDFIQMDWEKNERFFLIDIVEKDEYNELYIFPTRYLFEIMFKRPDGYFRNNDTIVYLYTEDYLHVNDSVWLKNVLTETHEVLGAPDFKVSWDNDSVIGPIPGSGDFNNIEPKYLYDPVPFKYIIKNGNIISKEIVQKLYYPDNRRPKGIRIIRTWPNWPMDRGAYFRGS